MATLVKTQALRSSGIAHRARAPVRCISSSRRHTKPVQATVAFVETEVATQQQSTRAAAHQRVQEVQAAIALKIKEAAVEAPARRMARDRVLLAACIKAAALQHILATNSM
jgi:hypothetical protein